MRRGTQSPYAFPAKSFKLRRIGGRPGPHDHVGRRFQPGQYVAARDLPQLPPQVIAPDRRLPVARHDHGQSRQADRGRPMEQIEMIRSTALPLRGERANVGRASQSEQPR